MRNIVLFVMLGSVSGLVLADFVSDIGMEFVTIGNPANQADSRIMSTDGTWGYGAVDYVYSIGKYEVTISQWNEFINAAGAPTGNQSNAYDQSSSSTSPQLPVDHISWYEAAQFCNYLTSGDKSKGVYEWSGNNANPGNFLGINRTAAKAFYGSIYFLPTENEWYKAAYFKSNGSGYSYYSNGTNIAPVPGVDSNNRDSNMNFSPPWNVGSGTEEQNGTFDMLGNLYEFTETTSGSDRVVRGGGYWYSSVNLSSNYRLLAPAYTETSGSGFRVASIPEPTSLYLLALGMLSLFKRKI